MRRLVRLLGVLALGVGLAACGGGGDGGGGAGGVVLSITGPMEAYVATMFVVTGEGFGAAGTTAQVRFTATDGDTPFDGYASAVATVDVDVLSDSRAIGVTPRAGSLAFAATVELLPAGGGALDGPGVLAWFQERIANLALPGDDTLVGGAHADTFHVSPGTEQDVITDIQTGVGVLIEP